MKKQDKELSYAQSYEELQKILEALEGDAIDVDQLSLQVKRAAELIESCQKRLKDAETEVKKVMVKFEKLSSEDNEMTETEDR